MNGRIWIGTALALACCGPVRAQQRYELVVEGSGIASMAERTSERLVVVDREGNATHYLRTPRHDSTDGAFLAYASESARRIIQWPRSDAGHMRIAEFGAGQPSFRPSQMVIRAIGGATEEVEPGAIESGQPYQLLPFAPGADSAAEADRLALEASADHRVLLGSPHERDSQLWQLVALRDGTYRIHAGTMGVRWSLAAGADGVPRLERTARDARQLWQLAAVPGNPAYRALMCVAAGPSPLVLTVGPGGALVLRPFTFAPGQLWRCRRLARALPVVFTQYRSASHEFRPNPPLPPARVEFVNDHRNELWALVVDRRNAMPPIKLKIPAGKSEVRELDRDAGGTLIEVYEQVTNIGTVDREEWATPVPPSILYDVSVYDVALQSIAIDRTVPGGKVEDVNYQPKSVGWFELPPGSGLSDGPLPLYDTAKQRGNPGGVRKIDPARWRPDSGTDDPVERLLNEFKKRNPQ